LEARDDLQAKLFGFLAGKRRGKVGAFQDLSYRVNGEGYHPEHELLRRYRGSQPALPRREQLWETSGARRVAGGSPALREPEASRTDHTESWIACRNRRIEIHSYAPLRALREHPVCPVGFLQSACNVHSATIGSNRVGGCLRDDLWWNRLKKRRTPG